MVEKVTREETSEDDSDYGPTYVTPNYEPIQPIKWNPGKPYCGYAPTKEYKRGVIEKAKKSIQRDMK